MATYEEQISLEQSAISALKNQLRNIKFPPRTINWQHSNIGKIRNNVQQRLEFKRQKAKINSKINYFENKIISLRDALFGV